MIDVENIIFTKLATALRAAYSGISVYGEYVEVPATFPFVTIVEADNQVLKQTRDLSGVEHYAKIMYEINVYSNKANGKKSQAKEISNMIDSMMTDLLFTRTFRVQTPNIDRTIYRITLRYEAVVREGIEVDGKTVHFMHTTR
jgi:hypothetical protein